MLHLRRNFCVLFIMLLITTPLMAQEQPLNCNVGPARKDFGGSPWLMYSCGDNHTLIFVTDEGSPAFPFIFSYYFKEGKYHLNGEGTGNKEATSAAFDELKNLSDADIAGLIQKTKQK